MRIHVLHATLPLAGVLDPEQAALIHGYAPPGVEITILLPRDAPRSIASRYEDALAMRGLLEQVAIADADGADAIVINCTADTALDAAREATAIPVVGVSEASLHLASQLSLRFSVLTFAERIAPRFEAMARQWGFAEKLASVRSVETPLEAIDRGALAADLVRQARICVDTDGAHLIVLGCTDFEIVGDAVEHLARAEGLVVPFIRPLHVGMRLAESLAAMNLAHSPLSFPPIGRRD